MSLSCAALLAFALGLLIYAVERDSTRLSFVPATWSLTKGHGGWRLMLQDSFPSFAHSYSLALIGCAWLARSWRQAMGIGLGLWGIEATFEILQHPPLHDWAGSPHWLRLLLVNHFDPKDLAASAIGVLAAWGSLAIRLRGSSPQATT